MTRTLWLLSPDIKINGRFCGKTIIESITESEFKLNYERGVYDNYNIVEHNQFNPSQWNVGGGRPLLIMEAPTPLVPIKEEVKITKIILT